MKKTKFLSVLCIIALLGLSVMPMMGCGEVEITPEMEELIREELAKLQGEQGEPGPAGPQGERGSQGEQGLAGLQGERGPTGSQGKPGPQGEAGEKGEAGSDGSSGPRGSDGSSGPSGATGPQGEQGEPGPITKVITVGYDALQAAIYAASPGDIIVVLAGTYNEAIVIDRQLTLLGANVGVNAVTGTRGSESIIYGETSTAITISADGVIIDGFTLDGGITLDDTANPISGGTISNNIITGADNPAEPIKAENGIRLGWDNNGKGVDGVTIENNTITGSLCKGIRFSNTKLDSNDPHDPQRISNITISGNEIKDNGSAGMETYGPGPNRIINNIISGNDGNGINLKFDDGDFVAGNIITNNKGPGITLRDVTNSVVENNRMSDHTSDEVFNEFVESGGGEGSKGSGIHIVYASENNTIRFNNMSGNNYGIFIHRGKATDKGQPSGNFINFNNISDNTFYGIFNALVDPPAPVDATNNWWGTTIEVEIEAMVSGDVNFDSFLEAPVE